MIPYTKKLVEHQLAWAKSWHFSVMADCFYCEKRVPCYTDSPTTSVPLICKDCLLSRAFGEVTK